MTWTAPQTKSATATELLAGRWCPTED